MEQVLRIKVEAEDKATAVEEVAPATRAPGAVAADRAVAVEIEVVVAAVAAVDAVKVAPETSSQAGLHKRHRLAKAMIQV
jgi:hypothetical protein